jgi:hypothetical protein
MMISSSGNGASADHHHSALWMIIFRLPMIIHGMLLMIMLSCRTGAGAWASSWRAPARPMEPSGRRPIRKWAGFHYCPAL